MTEQSLLRLRSLATKTKPEADGRDSDVMNEFHQRRLLRLLPLQLAGDLDHRADDDLVSELWKLALAPRVVEDWNLHDRRRASTRTTGQVTSTDRA